MRVPLQRSLATLTLVTLVAVIAVGARQRTRNRQTVHHCCGLLSRLYSTQGLEKCLTRLSIPKLCCSFIGVFCFFSFHTCQCIKNVRISCWSSIRQGGVRAMRKLSAIEWCRI